MQPAQASISTLASASLRAAWAKEAELHGSATTALQDGQLRTLKKDDTFAIFNHSGDAVAAPGSPEGIYNLDTRYLSHFRLAIENARPKLLSSTICDDNATLTCHLTNPDLFDPNEADGIFCLHPVGPAERLAIACVVIGKPFLPVDFVTDSGTP